jgi:hypothetical protein
MNLSAPNINCGINFDSEVNVLFVYRKSHHFIPMYFIYVMFFWVITPCSDVIEYQCFGGPCCLHLQ